MFVSYLRQCLRLYNVTLHFAVSHLAVSHYLTLNLTPNPNPNPIPDSNPKP